MKNQRCLWVEKNGRRWACEALESRKDADEALDKIGHLARRETRWTFESNLNLTSIINLTKQYMRFWQATNTFSSIHVYIYIYLFFCWGTRFTVDAFFSYGLSHRCLRWTFGGVQQAILLGRVALFADFCTVEWCNLGILPAKISLWERFLFLEIKETFYISETTWYSNMFFCSYKPTGLWWISSEVMIMLKDIKDGAVRVPDVQRSSIMLVVWCSS